MGNRQEIRMISQETLNECLSSVKWAGRPVLFKERVDSTNAWIMRLARYEEEIPADAGIDEVSGKICGRIPSPHGTLAVAEIQENGRGRRGRSWESPEGSGIWMSMLLRPQLALEKTSMITLVMAMAVRRTLNRYSGKCMIKWPNDIVIDGKKVCGILTEMGTCDDGWFIVCGTGINVNQDSFPENIENVATSLYLQTGTCYKREEIIGSIMRDLEWYYSQFIKAGDMSLLKGEYTDHLINLGRRVALVRNDGTDEGTAEGIDDEGCLIVRYDDGRAEAVRSGEVSVRGVLGYV